MILNSRMCFIQLYILKHIESWSTLNLTNPLYTTAGCNTAEVKTKLTCSCHFKLLSINSIRPRSCVSVFREVFLSSGDVDSCQSVSDNMATARPPPYPAEWQHPDWPVQSHDTHSSTSRGSRLSGWFYNGDVSLRYLIIFVSPASLGHPCHRILHAGSTPHLFLPVKGNSVTLIPNMISMETTLLQKVDFPLLVLLGQNNHLRTANIKF